MLRIGPDTLALLDTTEETLFLGLVTLEDEVLLKEASENVCPGHIEWSKMERSLEPKGGFSLVARGGKVLEIYRASVLNGSEAGGLLTEDIVAELKILLPVSEALIVYGH